MTPEHMAARPGSTVPPLVRTQDNDFWFDAAADGHLVIQRCTACRRLRHPPAPVCQHCRSFEWDGAPSDGAATLHSWCIVHQPRDPAFTYPLAIGLAALTTPIGSHWQAGSTDQVRLVADIAGVDHDDLRIGMPLQVRMVLHGNGERLPQLGPPPTSAPAAPREPA